MKQDKGTTELLVYYGGAPVMQTEPPAAEAFSLATPELGDRLQLVDAVGGLGADCCDRLGLVPGVGIRIVSRLASSSVAFAIEGASDRPVIAVGATIAQQIWVSRQLLPATTAEATPEPIATDLREMLVGSAGRVVGYDWAYRGYMGRFLSLGLAPGVEFVVRCLRSCGGAVEIELAGARLTLSAIEARALVVEPAGNELQA